MEPNNQVTTPDKPDINEAVEVLQRRWLSDNAFEIELTRPSALAFTPGQAVRLIHGSYERYYSIVSTPGDSTLTLCVHHVHRGIISPRLAEAAKGDVFRLTGPHGYFIFNPSPRTPVFVATGTGIAPFVSIVRSGIPDFILLHEVDLVQEFYYQDLFRDMASSYTPCISDPSKAGSSLPGIFQGRAADFIEHKLAPGVYDFYLCGNQEMTSRVTLLVDEQFPGSSVFREVFF